jgi:hypothetical protein
VPERKIIVLIQALSRSYLKNRILAQGQGGTEFQSADILKYFEELKRSPNTEIGTKDFFEMAFNKISLKSLPCQQNRPFMDFA